MSNAVALVGNLTRDPELGYTSSGTAKASCGLAVNRRWQSRHNGTWEESTSFFSVICWGELAEHVAECLPKGARVVVIGRLDQRSYETESGERRQVVEVVAEEIGPSLRWATAEVVRASRVRGAAGASEMTSSQSRPTYEEPF
jgi:single-strand DNA-binding protein